MQPNPQNEQQKVVHLHLKSTSHHLINIVLSNLHLKRTLNPHSIVNLHLKWVSVKGIICALGGL
jgi:hypothetical protein